MIGSKLVSTALVIGLLLTTFVPEAMIVAAVLGVIGVILMWLDK